MITKGPKTFLKKKKKNVYLKYISVHDKNDPFPGSMLCWDFLVSGSDFTTMLFRNKKGNTKRIN